MYRTISRPNNTIKDLKKTLSFAKKNLYITVYSCGEFVMYRTPEEYVNSNYKELNRFLDVKTLNIDIIEKNMVLSGSIRCSMPITVKDFLLVLNNYDDSLIVDVNNPLMSSLFETMMEVYDSDDFSILSEQDKLFLTERGRSKILVIH